MSLKYCYTVAGYPCALWNVFFGLSLTLCHGLWMQILPGTRLPDPTFVAVLAEMGISAGTGRAAPSLSCHFSSHHSLVGWLWGEKMGVNWQLLLLSFPCLFWWFAALPVAAQLVRKGSLLAGAL